MRASPITFPAARAARRQPARHDPARRQPVGRRSVAALVVCVLLTIAVAVGCMNPVEQAALELVNTERRAAGLRPLEANAELSIAAREFAEVLAREGRLRHSDTSRFLRDGRWSRIGENVGFVGGGPGPERQLQQAFLGSAAHRATQRGPYSHGGVGMAVAPDGRVFQVQLFATPR
jgi:uncharacterized protein YkwD